MRRSVQRWMQSRAWLRRHKARLGLFFRVTASALLSFGRVNQQRTMKWRFEDVLTFISAHAPASTTASSSTSIWSFGIFSRCSRVEA